MYMQYVRRCGMYVKVTSRRKYILCYENEDCKVGTRGALGWVYTVCVGDTVTSQSLLM